MAYPLLVQSCFFKKLLLLNGGVRVAAYKESWRLMKIYEQLQLCFSINEKRCNYSNIWRQTYHLARIYLRHPQWPEQACDHQFLKRKLLPSGRPRSPCAPQTQEPYPRIRPSYCGAGLPSMVRHFSIWVFQVLGAGFDQLKLQHRTNIFNFKRLTIQHCNQNYNSPWSKG